MKAWIKIAIAAAIAVVAVVFVCLVMFLPKENVPKLIRDIDIEKYASPALTVSEGGEITYTVKLTSRARKRAHLVVQDALPENTVLVSGDFAAEGSVLSAKVELKAKESQTLSYTVRLGEAYTSGTYVNAPAAAIGEKKTGECKNLVAKTLMGEDRERMRDAILALSYSEDITPVKLLCDMYLVAFSEAPGFEEALTPAQLIGRILAVPSADPVAQAKIERLRASVVPTLFGGAALSDAVIGELIGVSAVPRSSDFVIGDILLSESGGETNAYIFDGSGLISVMDGCAAADTAAVLTDVANADRYVVLRPSMTLASLKFAMPENAAALTEAQKVLIATAKAYLQRGYRVQYDNAKMANDLSGSYGGEYRWQIGRYNPEDYTSQKWGYLNCAAFAYECYRTALGMDLENRYTVRNLILYYTNGGEVGASEYPYFFANPSLPVLEEEKFAEEQKFLETLEVGDLVIINRKSGNGHVMMYIGGGILVHSDGASFDRGQETYEPAIRYLNVRACLFDPASESYLFREAENANHIDSLSIVRPLDAFDSETMQIPENSVNRMQNLSDIYSEKLSSHPEGMTVNKGDEVTFHFKLQNLGNASKTLAIEEVLPFSAALASEGDFTEESGVLKASVTVAPGETKTLSYTVQATGEAGARIYSPGSTVGGVLHACPAVVVGKTLSADQQSALLAAVEKYKASAPGGLADIDLVNAIYKEAGLASPFSSGNVHSSLFKKVIYDLFRTYYELNRESEYHSMVAPTLYGGQSYYTPQGYASNLKLNSDRSRLPREQALVIGDLIVAKTAAGEQIYIYIGAQKLLSLSSSPNLEEDVYEAPFRLMRIMGESNCYAVLRPSLG